MPTTPLSTLQQAQANYDAYAALYRLHPTPENKASLDAAAAALQQAQAADPNAAVPGSSRTNPNAAQQGSPAAGGQSAGTPPSFPQGPTGTTGYTPPPGGSTVQDDTPPPGLTPEALAGFAWTRLQALDKEAGDVDRQIADAQNAIDAIMAGGPGTYLPADLAAPNASIRALQVRRADISRRQTDLNRQYTTAVQQVQTAQGKKQTPEEAARLNAEAGYYDAQAAKAKADADLAQKKWDAENNPEDKAKQRALVDAQIAQAKAAQDLSALNAQHTLNVDAREAEAAPYQNALAQAQANAANAAAASNAANARKTDVDTKTEAAKLPYVQRTAEADIAESESRTKANLAKAGVDDQTAADIAHGLAIGAPEAKVKLDQELAKRYDAETAKVWSDKVLVEAQTKQVEAQTAQTNVQTAQMTVGEAATLKQQLRDAIARKDMTPDEATAFYEQKMYGATAAQRQQEADTQARTLFTTLAQAGMLVNPGQKSFDATGGALGRTGKALGLGAVDMSTHATPYAQFADASGMSYDPNRGLPAGGFDAQGNWVGGDGGAPAGGVDARGMSLEQVMALAQQHQQQGQGGDQGQQPPPAAAPVPAPLPPSQPSPGAAVTVDPAAQQAYLEAQRAQAQVGQTAAQAMPAQPAPLTTQGGQQQTPGSNITINITHPGGTDTSGRVEMGSAPPPAPMPINPPSVQPATMDGFPMTLPPGAGVGALTPAQIAAANQQMPALYQHLLNPPPPPTVMRAMGGIDPLPPYVASVLGRPALPPYVRSILRRSPSAMPTDALPPYIRSLMAAG